MCTEQVGGNSYQESFFCIQSKPITGQSEFLVHKCSSGELCEPLMHTANLRQNWEMQLHLLTVQCAHPQRILPPHQHFWNHMKEQQILKARILCELECTSTICTPSTGCNFKSSTSWQSQGSAHQMQALQNLLCATHLPPSPGTAWLWICLPKGVWVAEMPT